MAIFKINGTDMPSPANILHEFRSVGKSEENAAGNMVFDRLALKHDLAVEWKYLTAAQANMMLSAMTATVFVDVYFYDSNTQAYKTQEMTAEVRKVKDGLYENGAPTSFLDIQISFKQR